MKTLKENIAETIKEMREKACSGNPAAQYDLFVFLNAEAMELYDWELFEEAEKYLVQSAQKEYSEAIEALEKQEIRRYAFTKRVERNS